jgi:integrase/recombinase XerD
MENGRRVRVSLGTSNWKKADDILHEMNAGDPPERITVGDAGERLIADCKGRKLARETTGKYELLVKEMKSFFGERDVSGITLDDLARYRETWELSPISAKKKIERLRTFFRFCMERGWVKKNPAVALKSPSAKFRPTLPFTDEEMEKILWACEVYPDRPPGRRKQVRAFVLLLRYSGLRIRDAVVLRNADITAGKLHIYTAKTGSSVVVPLPDVALQAIAAIQKVDSDRFFWSGNGNPKSCVADWQRTLNRLFRIAGVEGHAHRFRDTFSVSLLQHGVSLENVSVLLGHSSIRVTEKHYAPWVKSRQEKLEEEVKKTWR